MICGACGSSDIKTAREAPEDYLCLDCGKILRLRLVPYTELNRYFPKVMEKKPEP